MQKDILSWEQWGRFITSSSSSSEDSGTVPVKATCICRMSYFTKSVTLPLPAMDFCFRNFRNGATFAHTIEPFRHIPSLKVLSKVSIIAQHIDSVGCIGP